MFITCVSVLAAAAGAAAAWYQYRQAKSWKENSMEFQDQAARLRDKWEKEQAARLESAGRAERLEEQLEEAESMRHDAWQLLDRERGESEELRAQVKQWKDAQKALLADYAEERDAYAKLRAEHEQALAELQERRAEAESLKQARGELEKEKAVILDMMKIFNYTGT